MFGIDQEFTGFLLTLAPIGIVRDSLPRWGRKPKARRIAVWLVRRSPHADCLHCGRRLEPLIFPPVEMYLLSPIPNRVLEAVGGCTRCCITQAAEVR